MMILKKSIVFIASQTETFHGYLRDQLNSVCITATVSMNPMKECISHLLMEKGFCRAVIPRIMNYSPWDYFFDRFVLEPGKNCGLTKEKLVRLFMKLLGNLGWSPFQMKKLKFVTPIPHIRIDFQGFMADRLNSSASLLSTQFHSPTLPNTWATQRCREYLVSTHVQETIPFSAPDIRLEDWKIKLSITTSWHKVNSWAGDCPRDSVVPERSLSCIQPAISWESSWQVGLWDRCGHIVTESHNSERRTWPWPLFRLAELGV